MHPANIRHVVGIIVNTAEAVTERKRCQHGGGLSAIGRGEHILNPHVRISTNADPAVHAIGNVLAVLVHPMQGIEDGCHHGQRAEVGIVQHFVMKLLGRRPAMNVESHRDHVGLLAEFAHDASVAILHKRAYGFSGIHNFERVQR